MSTLLRVLQIKDENRTLGPAYHSSVWLLFNVNINVYLYFQSALHFKVESPIIDSTDG